MTKEFMLTGRPLHPQAEPTADIFKKGRMNRREYLAAMAALGVSAAGAFALGGILPSPARAAEAKRGGTLRVAMNVKGWRDPRTFDGVEMSNVARQCNEYLVRWNSDFSLRAVAAGKLGGQRRRPRADAARAQGHHLVERRHVQRRRRDPQSRRAGAMPAPRAIRSPPAWARW